MKRRPPPHKKYHGYVQWVEAGTGKWAAILLVDGEETYVVMNEEKLPLPSEVEAGHLFTLHKTKAGEWYLFWPRWTKKQLRERDKRVRRAIARRRAAGWFEDDPHNVEVESVTETE